MACATRISFSEGGEYFTCLTEDGRLNVWETNSGVLKQQYTPNLHLSSPSSCLVWMRLSRESTTPIKRRKLKAPDSTGDLDVIVLGNTSGNILLYCVATGSILTELEGGHNSTVHCVSWARGSNLFSCAEEHIVEWSVGDKAVKSKWKAGKETVTNLLVLPDGKSILTASCVISWWSLPDHQHLKTFTGHGTSVSAMVFVPPALPGSETYFMSTSKMDRYLSAWSLNPESQNLNPVAQFLIDDVATCISLFPASGTEPATVTAVTRSGVLHVFCPQLNGKCPRPMRPVVTVKCVSEKDALIEKSDTSANSLPIIAAHTCGPNSVLIARGKVPFIAFEKISPDRSKQVLYLQRQDPTKNTKSPWTPANQMVASATEDAEYVSTLLGSVAMKRPHESILEVPMEDRINNLTLNGPQPSSSGKSRADNMAHLLLQGLRSKDKKILDSVLLQNDEGIIKRTVARLPVQVIVPLAQELSEAVMDKGGRCRAATKWLRAVIGAHTGQLLASPGAMDCLEPILGLIETRLSLLTPLSRLRGRLDLLIDQIDAARSNDEQQTTNFEGGLLYQDAYSSDDESAVGEVAVESDSDHWDFLSEEGEENEIPDGEDIGGLDVDMSD